MKTNIEGSNKLLVLGSDYGTIDLVKAAHKRGLYVVVTDLMTSSPTKEEADEAWMISTADIDLLEQKCREENIGAVLTGASDFNIGNSRELCRRLGFPVYCASDKAWDIATNKRHFKDICKQVGAPIATDYKLSDKLTDEELGTIQFPVVVKPVDLSGNRGMSYCSNKDELRTAWKKAKEASKNSTIIVERQLHGPEYAVNYIMADGEIHLHFFSAEHHEPGELSNLYTLIETTSYHLKQYIEEVNDKVIKVFKEAGCRDGVAWVETMLDDDGHFYLLEMGYRYGGEVINSAYRHICGFDSIDWMVEIACGVKHTAADLPNPLTTCYRGIGTAYMFFAKKDGVVATIEGLDKVERLPGVTLDIPKREGGNVRYHATMGVVHIASRDVEELCDSIVFINNNLKIKNADGEDRVVANECCRRGLKCYIISPKEASEMTFNSQMMELFGAYITTVPLNEVHDTIEKKLEILRDAGMHPFFIKGGGHGNIGTEAYVQCYQEIKDYEIRNNTYFDYIFFASGTGTTHAGLVCGQILSEDQRQIIGISIARKNPRGRDTVIDSIRSYLGENAEEDIIQQKTIFIDEYTSGYGKEDSRVRDIIGLVLKKYGIPLDETYTGKAFMGMSEYIKSISGKNILFIHTGGTPLFFDILRCVK